MLMTKASRSFIALMILALHISLAGAQATVFAPQTDGTVYRAANAPIIVKPLYVNLNFTCLDVSKRHPNTCLK